MNKRILFGISILLIVICLFLFFATRFYSTTLIAQDGYFVSGSSINRNLMSNKKKVKLKSVKLSKMSQDDIMYKNLGGIFVGSDKKKKEVNISYPVYTNNGLAIVNMNNKNRLINKKFEFFDSYENFTITDGKLYNYGEYKQSDYEDYIFLGLENGSYVNLVKLEFPMLYKGKTIPLNSIINFQDKYIKYYYYNNKHSKLLFDIIEGIDLDDTIIVGDKKYSYEDFLINLGLREEKDNESSSDDVDVLEDEYILENTSFDKNKESELSERKYVKPKVSAQDFAVNVYSGVSKLSISDPSGVIIGGINFQLFIGDKLYSRKVFVSSGKIQITGLMPNTTFKIVGNYKFYSEDKKKVEATFFEQTVTTGDYKKLDPIEIAFDNGDIYSNKIELSNFRIVSSLDNEALKGLNKAKIVINGENYNISANLISSIIKGKSVSYSSPTALKSNSSQTYEIFFYDSYGNALNISNNKGSSRTSKEPPASNFKVTKGEVNYTDFEISLSNPDNVSIHNYRYIICNNDNSIVDEGILDASLSVQNFTNTKLDPNSTYYVKILGDYDLMDGKGTISNASMGEGKFTTMPLSSLGYIRVNTLVSDVTSDSAVIKSGLELDSISSVLLQLLTSFKIEVYDEASNSIYSRVYSIDELQDFISGNLLINEISGLQSITTYSIVYTAFVTQGKSSEKINVISGVKSFKTHKRDAYVDIQNRFVNNNMIDFDVRIVDSDQAIDSDRVLLEVRDPYSKLIAMENLEVNGSYVQLTYTKLEANVNYSFKYYAEQYNVGFDNSTFENDYILKQENINTEDGITGHIELQDMLRQTTGDNLFNLRDYDRIRKEGNIGYKKYDLDNNAVMFGGKNGYVNFSYYIPEVYGKHVKVSFYAKYDKKTPFKAPVYISNNYGNQLYKELEDLGSEYKKYTFSFYLPSNYIGFLLNTPASRNERTDVWFKDIKIVSDTDNPSMPVNLSYHSSGYRFTNTVMYSGLDYFHSYNEEKSYLKGNPYEGHARITNIKTKQIFDFSYTGSYQTFKVPSTDDYRIELWGAAGGNHIVNGGAGVPTIGGRGAYTSGDIHLEKNKEFYIYVGGKGADAVVRTISPGGWNGGGQGDWDHSDDETDGGGGGATDIRLVSGAWDNADSLKSRIMVAGGGGGASDGSNGGAAGSLSSFAVYSSIAATQISGYAFGVGQDGIMIRGNYPVAGGGGGYYGGYATDNGSNYYNPASGGSSYISGHKGCVAYGKADSVPSMQFDDDYSELDEYLASFKVNLLDKKHEITGEEYYIRIYLDGNEISSSPYKYDIVDYNVLDEIKQYSLRKNKKYTVTLSVKIRNRYYDIDSIDITTNTEIRSIKSVDEFFDIHPNGKYVVVNDLDFTSINKNIYDFYGEMDFQGHKVTLNWNGRGNLFEYTRGGSVLKNVVLDVYLDNPSAKAWNSPFVRYNYGTIDNVLVNVLASTDVPNYADGVITYANYSAIKNFVIYNAVEVHVQNRFGLVTYSNQGLIKNGYVYGEDIDAHFESINSDKNVGVIADEATTNSNIQNVFSLIGVKKDSGLASENYVGNLLGYAYVGKMQNCFSVETNENSTNLLNQDPNFGHINAMSAKNVYYASKRNYAVSLSSKISYLSLYDVNFLDNVLNSDKKFKIDTFVELGYYPQLVLNDCMPNLEWIALPSLTDEDLIDVTSVEEVSNDGDSATLKLFLNNPAAEKIVSIGIQDIQTVEVLDQEDNNGKSVVTVKMSNPIAYRSKYYLRKITSKGQLNYTYDTDFSPYERPLDIVMYYSISDISDWKRMNQYPDENYILKNDLDFEGVAENSIYISQYFSGILNGNNHTIKNIKITSKSGVFERLIKYAVIKDLFIENYNKTSNTSYAGFISFTREGSPTLDNVHMVNATIKGASYIGSLIGYSEGGVIINCSVTGFKSVVNPDASDIRIGGLAGLMTSSVGNKSSDGYIANSYAQDIDIDILDSISTYGIGGIVGQMSSGSITNAYATGSIKNNSIYTGGIVGYASAIISNCWSDVNIYTELDFVGGIVGRRDHDNISSTLVFGPVYSSYDGQNINRTSGNTLLIPQKNYFWDQQQFYGYVVGNATAEKPLSSEQLNNRDTYYDLLDFEDNFDYTGIENGILPKLKSTYGELLPHQRDYKYTSEKFNIRGSIQTTQRVEDGDIYFILENPDNYEITTVSFDYLRVDSANLKITNTGDGYTIVSASNVKPIRYYDAYTLTGVSYKKNSNSTPTTVYKFVKIELQFYKTLSSYTDWRSISSSTTENYRLTGDLDFSGITNINTNVSIGRLEGQGEGYSIKNITINDISSSFSLIRKITTSLKNVRFENITLRTKSTTSFSYYCNIIRLNFADVDNVEFNNITIDAPNVTYYVAPIGINRAQSLRNIKINNNNITGKNYVGGLIASSQNYDAYMITASNITVYGNGDRVGGIAGQRDYANPTRWFYFSGTNMNVTGKNYTGGLFGEGGANYSSLKDSTIHGLSGAVRIGGISGINRDRYANYYDADNIDVIADDNVTYTGGLFGDSYDTSYCYIKNSRIVNNGTGAVFTGGIQGYKGGYTNNYNGVLNTKITSLGTGGTGGLVGYSINSGGNNYNYITKTEITAASNVGGAIGFGKNSRLYNTLINAKIVASGNKAGGVYGYIANADPVSDVYSDVVYSVILENSEITAANEAALFAGYVDGNLLFDKFFYNIHLMGNVNTTSGAKYGIDLPQTSGAVGISSNLPRFYVYTNDSLNGNNVKNIDFLSETLSYMKLITASDLTTQAYYTSRGIGTNYYKFTDYDGNNLLNNRYYPFVNNLNGQIPILLPTSTVEYLSKVRMASQIHELPKVDVYSSGINTINIEFDDVDDSTRVEIYENRKVVFDQYVQKRVYTFDYDYTSSIEIVLSNGRNKKVYSYEAEDLRNKVSTFKNSYAYIYQDKLKGNIKSPNDNFIHIYDRYALTEKLAIYDMLEEKFISSSNKFSLSNIDTRSLFHFDIDKVSIDTYYRYSVIHKKEGDTIYEGQLFYQDGVIEIVDGELNNYKFSTIVGKSGNKNYLTVLGRDGIIYNLKDEILFPSRFTNKNIRYMSHNINNDSNMVVVMYESGGVVVFDFRTGSQKLLEKATEKVSIFDYIKKSVNSKESMMKKNVINDYYQGVNLIKKLEENPISDDGRGNYILDDKNSSNKSFGSLKSNYVTYYNTVKNSYDVVNISDIVSGDNSDVISENDKIYTSTDLISFYMQDGIYSKNKSPISIILLLSFVLLSLMVALYFWFINARKLKVEVK